MEFWWIVHIILSKNMLQSKRNHEKSQSFIFGSKGSDGLNNLRRKTWIKVRLPHLSNYHFWEKASLNLKMFRTLKLKRPTSGQQSTLSNICSWPRINMNATLDHFYFGYHLVNGQTYHFQLRQVCIKTSTGQIENQNCRKQIWNIFFQCWFILLSQKLATI